MYADTYKEKISWMIDLQKRVKSPVRSSSVKAESQSDISCASRCQGEESGVQLAPVFQQASDVISCTQCANTFGFLRRKFHCK